MIERKRRLNPRARQLTYRLRQPLRMKRESKSIPLLILLLTARKSLDSTFYQMLMYRDDWRYDVYTGSGKNYPKAGLAGNVP